MKITSRFETKDGKLFADEGEAIKWERLIDDCASAVKPLGTLRPDSNGANYVQHDAATVLAVKTALLEIAKPYFLNTPHFQGDPAKIHPMGVVGRYIDDSDLRPLNSVWWMISVIDDEGREWGQPFYALNPGGGKLVCLNPKGKS